MDETKDWIANTRQELSRRQFLAGTAATGVSLVGFAAAATPVAGQVIRTGTEGLSARESAVASGDLQVPIYAARPARGSIRSSW